MKRRTKFVNSEGIPSEQFVINELKAEAKPLHIRSQRLWISTPVESKKIQGPLIEPKVRTMNHMRRALIRKSIRSQRKRNKPMALKRGIDFTASEIRYYKGIDDVNDLTTSVAEMGYLAAKRQDLLELRVRIKTLRSMKALLKRTFNEGKTLGTSFFCVAKYFISSHLRRLLWIRRNWVNNLIINRYPENIPPLYEGNS
jgi:hypothetical protein